ncbi:hypothetical protein FG386_000949 [Cryptosporidium ryanae]|uniref:uncharacterized protein n=1 Tax=Cryptosporidium ryanae TaxID=515981 RepID=UPI00351AA605|nr:hypothetical protein FG386_000949 [Cryptosporidium ryanae]
MTGMVSEELGGKLDILSSLALTSNESSSSFSKYSVKLLLLVGLSLREDNRNSDDQKNKSVVDSVKPLTLEPRPPVIESSENIKTYTNRFGTNGFISRTNRGTQRGRIVGGNVSGITRSIIKQEDDNLWDMPCSDMGNLTLGDIREAESKIKAEDITLDQYVEKRKEFIIKRGPVFPSETRQTNNHSQLIGVEEANDSSNARQLFSGKDQRQQNILDSGINSNGNGGNFSDKLVEQVSKRVVTVIPSASNRKLSTFSGDFLKGPANLSLFDMNTPIFDDDCNDSTDFYTSNVDLANKTMNQERTNTGILNTSKVADTLSTKHAEVASTTAVSTTITSSSTTNLSSTTTSNFSWSNRIVNQDDSQKNNINLANLSASFPALSKNTQINQTFNKGNVLGGNSQSQQIESNNILHRLQTAAGLSSKLATGNNLSDKSSNNLDRNGAFYNNKYNQNNQILKPNGGISSNEYPPLSSASNIGSGYSTQGGVQQRTNQVKTNDAGRLLMSIIGAGQHKNDSKGNLGGYSRY